MCVIPEVEQNHLSCGLARVILAEGTSALVVEALTLQVLFAERAVEALAMVVVVQGLHPSVASFHGEAAGEALGGEQLVPIGLAVRVSILQEEGPVAKDLAALAAGEALRMEVFANGIQTVTLDFASALAASGRQVLLETVLAVQIALLLNESNVLQRTTAVAVHADEMIRAPDAAQCRDKGS